jgi:hypothetical protein
MRQKPTRLGICIRLRTVKICNYERPRSLDEDLELQIAALELELNGESKGTVKLDSLSRKEQIS